MHSDASPRPSDPNSASITFGELADQYLAFSPRRRTDPDAFAKEEERIERDLRPAFGLRLAEEISRGDAEALVADMMNRGVEPLEARHARQAASQILKFGVSKKLIDDNPLSFNYGVPRAWGAPLLGFVALMVIGIAWDGVTSADADYIQYAAVVPAWVTWRVWTKKGKYSPFSLEDIFAVDGHRVGPAHLVAWGVVCLLVLLMLSGAIGDLHA